MAPLGTDDAAVIAGLFARPFGGITLHKVNVQDKLVKYCTDEGEALVDLALDDDSDGWQDEWRERAKDAGISKGADVERLLRWLAKRRAPGSSAPDDPTKGVATAVVEALEAEGAIISSTMLAAATSAISTRAAGDEQSQCTSVVCVWLLTCSMLPTADDIEWYSNQQRAAPAGESTPVDISGRDSVIAAKKTGSVILLRALANRQQFKQWMLRMQKLLKQNALPQAGFRLGDVVAHGERIFGDEDRSLMRYLRELFCVEFLGRGLPAVTAPVAESAEHSNRRATGPLPISTWEMMIAADKVASSNPQIFGLVSAPPVPQPAPLQPASAIDLSSLRSSSEAGSSSGASHASTVDAVIAALESRGIGSPAPPPTLPPTAPVQPPAAPGAFVCFICRSATCLTADGQPQCRRGRRMFQLLRTEERATDAKRAADKAKREASAAEGE